MRCEAIQGLTEQQAIKKEKLYLIAGASVERYAEGQDPQGRETFTVAAFFSDAPDRNDAPDNASTPAAQFAAAAGHASATTTTMTASLGAAPAPAVAGGAPGVVSTTSPMLGALSREFESNGRPAAIGCDKHGGFSYGQYQIACGPGTMAKYLGFLQTRQPALFRPLQAAGGAAAAAAGSDSFKAAWRALAPDPAFAESQHAFIAETHFHPFVRNLLSSLGLDVMRRSAALRDVAWSVAVQHGAHNKVIDNALGPLGQPLPDDDAALIRAIYDERSKVDLYFSSSTPETRLSVADRFRRERALALKRTDPPDTAMA